MSAFDRPMLATVCARYHAPGAGNTYGPKNPCPFAKCSICTAGKAAHADVKSKAPVEGKADAEAVDIADLYSDSEAEEEEDGEEEDGEEEDRRESESEEESDGEDVIVCECDSECGVCFACN